MRQQYHIDSISIQPAENYSVSRCTVGMNAKKYEFFQPSTQLALSGTHIQQKLPNSLDFQQSDSIRCVVRDATQHATTSKKNRIVTAIR